MRNILLSRNRGLVPIPRLFCPLGPYAPLNKNNYSGKRSINGNLSNANIFCTINTQHPQRGQALVPCLLTISAVHMDIPGRPKFMRMCRPAGALIGVWNAYRGLVPSAKFWRPDGAGDCPTLLPHLCPISHTIGKV